LWEACGVPWVPELFSAPALQRLLDDRRRDKIVAVPFFEGFLAGEPDALVESFAGEPVVYDPRRGRVKGEPAFRTYITQMGEWLAGRDVAVEPVQHVVLAAGGFEEVVVHVDDGAGGRVALPIATVADRAADGRILELRMYHSTWPLTGRRATRQPLLQARPELTAPDAVTEHQEALGAGDVDAVLAAFEPDGYARESTGAERVHSGPDALRAFYDRMLGGGGVTQQCCAIVGDEGTCALEYDVVRWGEEELLPQAGMSVYVRGSHGRLAAVRVYDDVAPSIGTPEA
jgi:hypothetical protein